MSTRLTRAAVGLLASGAILSVSIGAADAQPNRTVDAVAVSAQQVAGIPVTIPATIGGVATTVQGTINKFAVQNGQLVALTSIPALNQTLAIPVQDLATAGSCQILDLTLGPLDLDLLGLQVHLNQVHLNITAQSGSGNLLGNLLCAVVHLFDNGTLNGLSNLLNGILGRLIPAV